MSTFHHFYAFLDTFTQRACNKEEHYALALLYTIFGNSNGKGYQEKIQLLFTVCDKFISKH